MAITGSKRFDPTKHKVVVNFGAYYPPVVIQGHAMSDWCTFTKDNPNADNDISGDGEETVNFSVDNRGTATLNLKQNSSSRLLLDEGVNTANLAKQMIDSIVYSDLNTGYTYYLRDCFLENEPEGKASDKNGDVTYTFKGSQYMRQTLTGTVTSIANAVSSLLG